jgi:hypothetical protein
LVFMCFLDVKPFARKRLWSPPRKVNRSRKVNPRVEPGGSDRN